MPLKIPSKLKIGGHIWDIKYPYIFTERFDRYAQCNDAKKIIFLSAADMNGDELPSSVVLVSFIHELLHAASFLIGQEDIFSGDEGEKIVTALSETIYQILVDNKELHECLKPTKK